MSSILFSSSFTLYDFPNPPHIPTQPSPFNLSDICCDKIVQSDDHTKHALEVIPNVLKESLLKAALKANRDKCVEEIIVNWPCTNLVLNRIMPPVFSSFKPLYNRLELADSTRKAIKYTTSLVHTFMELLKKKIPVKLNFLDLTDFPSVEVIINYIVAHILLIYNEKSQREIVSFYNKIAENLPFTERKFYTVDPIVSENECLICMDVYIETAEAHMEICRALSVTSKPKALLKLAVSHLDMCGLGVAKTIVLLELIDPKYFKGANLQYNSISNDSLRLLEPSLSLLTHITSLDLSFNRLSAASQSQATQLSILFSHFPKLRRLNLGHTRMSNNLHLVLSNLSHPLEMLRLPNCSLTESDLSFLLHSPLTKSLRELDLSQNDLSNCPDTFIHFVVFLSDTLTLLEVEDVKLNSQQMAGLFQKLIVCGQLRYLNVMQNECLKREVVMDSFVYFFVTPMLEAVKITYPIDIVEGELSLMKSRKEYCKEIEQIIYCLCLVHNRNVFKISFEV